MMIEYKPRDSTFGQDEYWIYTGENPDSKRLRFKRVACGLVMPRDDEPQAVLVTIAEKYKSKEAPPEFTALKARVGGWLEIEQGLGDMRRQYKFSTLVTEPMEEGENDFLKKIPGLRYASDTIPLSIVTAPKHALTELARQKVDGFILTGRLNVEAVKNVLDQAPNQAGRALQCLIMYLSEHPAYYEKPTPPPRMPPSWMSA
jgi:hypothetical protein